MEESPEVIALCKVPLLPAAGFPSPAQSTPMSWGGPSWERLLGSSGQMREMGIADYSDYG